MFRVELLHAALAAAERLGYEVRYEHFGGRGGGFCELKGKRLLLVDLAQGPLEQLDSVVAALRSDRRWVDLPLPEELRTLIVPEIDR